MEGREEENKAPFVLRRFNGGKSTVREDIEVGKRVWHAGPTAYERRLQEGYERERWGDPEEQRGDFRSRKGIESWGGELASYFIGILFLLVFGRQKDNDQATYGLTTRFSHPTYRSPDIQDVQDYFRFISKNSLTGNPASHPAYPNPQPTRKAYLPYIHPREREDLVEGFGTWFELVRFVVKFFEGLGDLQQETFLTLELLDISASGSWC